MKKKQNKIQAAIGLILLLAAAPTVMAAETLNSHAHATISDLSPMQTELMDSMQQMHEGMNEGLHHENADKAFAIGMIAHHKGAIDMAKIELKYGKDPEMRQLAEQIIAAQDPEIKQMQAWLSQQSK